MGPLRIADNQLHATAFIVAIVCAGLSVLALVLRFVATTKIHRKHGWEDWFAVLATIFFISYVVPLLYLLRVMNGRDAYSLPKDDLVTMTQAGYFMAAQFCPQQLFAKLSILFLYYRLYWVSRPFVITIYLVGTVQTVWSLVTYVLHWVECSPPAKLWNPKLQGTCLNHPVFLAAGEPWNSVVDFVLVGMAVWMINSLKMKGVDKLKLCILFALGILAGVLGFVKIGLGYGPMAKDRVALLDPIWATVQQACGVLCCCAPLYKPLLPPSWSRGTRSLRSFGKLFSKRSGSGSGSGSGGSNSNLHASGSNNSKPQTPPQQQPSMVEYKGGGSAGKSSSSGSSPKFAAGGANSKEPWEVTNLTLQELSPAHYNDFYSGRREDV